MSEKVRIIEKIVVEDSFGERLSDFGIGRFESLPSRKSVKKAIKRGLLLVNNQIATTAHRVSAGEEIAVIADEKIRPVYERSLTITYEDDHMAAVQKPADLPVSGNTFRTLQNALDFNLKKSDQIDSLAVPRPVHRLDRLTGGLILVAKTIKAAKDLGNQFEERTVKKSYLAWVSGKLVGNMNFHEPIEGKAASTLVLPQRVINHHRFGELTLVEVIPKTGRRNQIRIHLSEAGFPILGDLKFQGIKSGKGLFLYARKIEFDHPQQGNRLTVEAQIPKKFKLA